MTDGILLLDKPTGISSNGVLFGVRRWAAGHRVGHVGTLDPLATGLLPVMIGRATRLLRFLPTEPKRYLAVARFGVSTSTHDTEGDVEHVCDPGQVAPDGWEQMIQEHHGDVNLSVPLYAAVKQQGRRLYSYARAGQSVTPPVRTMQVHRLETDVSGWPWVRLEIECAGGTYVRSIVASLGEQTGFGAHLASLRRTNVGVWSVDAAIDPSQLGPETMQSAAFIGMDRALQLTRLRLDDGQVSRIATGRAPERVLAGVAQPLAAGEAFLFTDSGGRLLAVARSCAPWAPCDEPPPFEFERVLTD